MAKEKKNNKEIMKNEKKERKKERKTKNSQRALHYVTDSINVLR